MSIDWLKASVKERKILYGFLKRALDEKNKTTSVLHHQLFGVFPSSEYDKTLRSGRYARKKAVQYYRWLEEVSPASAAAVIEKIAAHHSDADNSWQRLLATAQECVKVMPYEPRPLSVVKFAPTIPIQEIDRGRPFYLRFNAPHQGFAFAVQRHRSLFYPLFLNRQADWVPVQAGSNDRPLDEKNEVVDPLCEEIDTGLFEFFILLAEDKTIDLKPLAHASNQPVSLATLNTLAEALMETKAPLVLSTSLLVT